LSNTRDHKHKIQKLKPKLMRTESPACVIKSWKQSITLVVSETARPGPLDSRAF